MSADNTDKESDDIQNDIAVKNDGTIDDHDGHQALLRIGKGDQNRDAYLFAEMKETTKKLKELLEKVNNQIAIEHILNYDQLSLKQPECSHLGDCPICFLPLPLDTANRVQLCFTAK